MHKASFDRPLRQPLKRLAEDELITCCGLGCGKQFEQNPKLICPFCQQKNWLALHPLACSDCGAKLLCHRDGFLVTIPDCICKATPEQLQHARAYEAQCAAAKQRDNQREEAAKQHRADAVACWERKEHKCKIRLTNPAAPFCKYCPKFNQEAKRG